MKPVMMFLSLLAAIAVGFMSGSAIATAADFDPAAWGYVFAGAAGIVKLIPLGLSGQFASVIDVSDLVSDYGAYYKQDKGAAERRKRLKNKLYNTTAKFDSHFTVVETDSTREEWAYSEHSEVLQPYQTGWTSKGDHTIKPNPAQLFWAKYDLSYIPDHLVLTWAGFLRENKLSVDECPFVQYVIENHVIPQGHEDWKTKVSFLGSYVAPTPGTAGSAATTANGVRKVIRDQVTATAISPFTQGTIPTDAVEFVEYMEDMTFQIPEQYRDKSMSWRMNDTHRLLYFEGFMEKYNKFFARSKDDVENLFIFKKTNIGVEGFTEMGTSDLIFIAAKDNSLKLQKGSAKKEILKVETLKRELYLFTDFHAGYHFPNPTEVWCNDQDLS